MFYLRVVLLTALLVSTSSFAAPVKDFSFEDSDGKTLKLSDYRGKWVVANYWAIFCPPCRVEIPDLIRFVNNNPDDVVVLGMDAGMDTPETLKQFIADQGINYPIIPTQESTMYAFGEVVGIPTTFIISPEGELVDTHVGLLSYENLEFYVDPNKSMEDDPQPNPKPKGFWSRLLDWG